ncbi:MAG: SOS response-associated peptidase family protein [Ignavibacteria bacterium]
MCGRYENAADDAELQKEFEKYIGELNIAYDLDEVLKDLKSDIFRTENIAPTNLVKVITFDKENNVFKLKLMKWGIKSQVFDPSRAAKGKDPMIEKDIFNSKIETILKKGSKWKKIFDENRCIFPMTAFYEWTGIKGSKVPQRITIQRTPIFFAGGVIKQGIDKKESASIITCEPNTFMSSIHTRMPVLFKTEKAGEFLSSPNDIACSVCEPLDDGTKMKLEKAVLK